MGSRWLFSPAVDLLAFGGSTAAAFLVVALAAAAGRLDAPVPTALWLLLVVGVDVAHVHATWLRTYWDPAELRAHRARYLLVPLLAYAAGLALHLRSPLAFWRALAYLAVFHFVRQQVGWMALYRRKDPGCAPWDRRLDELATYAATLWPLLWWHGHLPRRFSWFVAEDFAGPLPARLAAWTLPVYVCALLAWALRQAGRGEWPWGRALVLGTTALSWWAAIVHWNSDLAFTALNVLPHGVPYAVLVWRRSREQGAAGWSGWLLRAGLPAFLLVIAALALAEEGLWDAFIWHDHPGLFGAGWDLGALAQALLVPLLALPQSMHYALDGMIWRRPAA